MFTRRKFLVSASGLTLFPLAGCSTEDDTFSYDDVVLQTYRHAQRPVAPQSAILKELVRYATMAANSHNSQPWKFKIDNNQIQILPDFRRRCPVVDPDDHHLFASLGCAAENCLTAAKAFGLHGDVLFDDTNEATLVISFEETEAQTLPVFEAITRRQCTRTAFDGSQVPTTVLNDVVSYANMPGVDIRLLTTGKEKNIITDYVVEGNGVQMDDKAFVDELRSWIRFNEKDALQLRDGPTYRSNGTPSVPSWLGAALFKLMYRKKVENDKYREQITSSSGIAVFSCAEQSRADWVNVGRTYQRFALQSTVSGFRHAFINQPVEVASIRPQLADYLGLRDRLPDLIIRYGYAEPTPRTLRRPVNQVII